MHTHTLTHSHTHTHTHTTHAHTRARRGDALDINVGAGSRAYKLQPKRVYMALSVSVCLVCLSAALSVNSMQVTLDCLDWSLWQIQRVRSMSLVEVDTVQSAAAAEEEEIEARGGSLFVRSSNQRKPPASTGRLRRPPICASVNIHSTLAAVYPPTFLTTYLHLLTHQPPNTGTPTNIFHLICKS